MEYSGKTVVVTGGAGFIGSHLVDALLARGAHVRVIDDLSTGRRENIQHVLGQIEFIEDSILNTEVLTKEFTGADCVFHQAAIPSVPRSIADPLKSHTVNTTGTLSVLIAARDAGVRRIVYASSSSFYGDTPVLLKVETMGPNPISPYAVQKYVSERYMQLFYTLYGLETVGLRYFNVYGPRQNPHSEYSAVIPRFIRMIKNNETPAIYGDGTASRDFTYIDDAVQANLLAADALAAPGEVFNIAGGASHTIQELFDTIKTTLGSSIEPQYVDRRKGDIEHSSADISKALRLLGYKPTVPFGQGLQRTIESFA